MSDLELDLIAACLYYLNSGAMVIDCGCIEWLRPAGEVVAPKPLPKPLDGY
jgi:hypothetical protein